MPFLIVLTDPTLEMLVRKFLKPKEAKALAVKARDSEELYRQLKGRDDYLFLEGYNGKFTAIKRSRLGFVETLTFGECEDLLAKRKASLEKQGGPTGPRLAQPGMIIPRNQK